MSAMAEFFDLFDRGRRFALTAAALTTVPFGLIVDWIAWRRLAR